jgi:hypothetical protein
MSRSAAPASCESAALPSKARVPAESTLSFLASVKSALRKTSPTGLRQIFAVQITKIGTLFRIRL